MNFDDSFNLFKEVGMRISALVLVLAMVAAPAMADIGSVSLFISSPDDGSGLDLDGTVNGVIDYGIGLIPATVPIQIGFSATSSGTSGPNNGVQGVVIDTTGSALAGILQTALIPDPVFTNLAFLGGLGFDLLPNGTTGAVGIIAGAGNAQALPGSWNAVLDADFVGHAGNVPIASGPATVNGQSGTIDVAGNANLWTIGHGSSVPATAITGASLTIIPEPTTALLLAPALLVLRRRRRA